MEPEDYSVYKNDRMFICYLQPFPSWGPTGKSHCMMHYVKSSFPFFPQIAVGTKTGEVLLFDLASSSLVETIKAHTSTIWSMHIRPDREALVTGSADKDIKFWEFEREDTGSSYMQGSIQSLVHVRTLKMSDDVLSVRFSPNGKLLAVALLDSTVKLFYQDTLKFFLSLYGHKVCLLLP